MQTLPAVAGVINSIADWNYEFSASFSIIIIITQQGHHGTWVESNADD